MPSCFTSYSHEGNHSSRQMDEGALAPLGDRYIVERCIARAETSFVLGARRV